VQPPTYRELKRTIKDAGLLAKQPRYYALKISILLALFLGSLTVLFTTQALPLLLANALLSAFVYSQLGLLGHDAGHNQIFRSQRANARLGWICGNLLLGMDLQWWKGHHNAHHARPNQEGYDPDADIPVLAFTAEQAARRTGLFRWCSRNQSFLLPLISCWQVFDLNVRSVKFLAGKGRAAGYWQSALLAAHFVLYGGILVISQGWTHALLFTIVQRVASGCYLTAIFATNHAAMPVLQVNQTVGFLEQQIATSRNVRAPRWLGFVFGGLHFQIEHHLFPAMPQNQLARAQPIVRQFCQANNIPYRELGLLQTYREIFSHMWAISKAMRQANPAPGQPVASPGVAAS
jgi:fatty acid desaturase